MSEPAAKTRPRQLTTAAWCVIGGSLYLLLTAFDTLSGLRSVDTRRRVEDVLATRTGSGLGISVEQALSGMRVGLEVTAVSAVCAAILGFFVLRGHQGARIGLSVVVVPLLLTSPLTGGVLGVVVAVATLLVWSGPARDWFAGRPVRVSTGRLGQGPRPQAPVPPPEPAPPTALPRVTPPPDVSPHEPSSAPAPSAGFGQPPAAASSAAGPFAPPAPTAPAAVPFAPSPWPSPTARRTPPPAEVKVACIVTWVFSGAVALLYAVMAVVLLVAQDRIVKLVLDSPAWARSNLRPDLLVPVLWLGCLLFLGWSLAACVLAFFTWRGHGWARWLLVASAAAAFVAAVFALPVGIPNQIACAVTFGGLLTPRARAWFAYREVPGAAPTGPGGPHGPGGTGGPDGGSGRPPVW